MKKKIVILGSTGSVGSKTFEIIKKDRKNFQVVLLSTYSNLDKIFSQAEELSVKNIIINDLKTFEKAKKKINIKKINIFNKFEDINTILNKHKIYYSMVSVSTLEGLKPTIILSKYSRNLAVVNKESLICGWNLIKKQLIKFKTNFICCNQQVFS